jgi:DUF1680 family protein
MTPPAPRAVRVQLGGVLGEAIDASRRGRLARFVTGPDSPAIALFARAARAGNRAGDWYGEHAGKWLVAASRAVARGADPALAHSVRSVADFLCDQQDADGYLGTYADDHRFTVPQPPKPPSWDGAPSVRTWDVWTHAYLVLGLIEAWRTFGVERWLAAAQRIGDLCIQALDNGIAITDLGNHHGLSATVLIDPATELHLATGEQRFLDLALRVLAQADAHPPLALLQKALAGADASEIATGKAYQLAWNLVGLAKLHRATGRADLRDAVEALWANIEAHHLALGGGPFGGIGHRSREVFNPRGVFSPRAYVETCSTLAWIQLNHALLAITDHPRHAEAIERAAFNDLLGAMAPNGEDWCYYGFANGRRTHTTYWRCCKSSGAMALEELPPLALRHGLDGAGGDVLTLDVYAPAELRATLADGTVVRILEQTRYPFDGRVELAVETSRPAAFTLRLRVPPWADGATLELDDAAPQPLTAGVYASVERPWRGSTRIVLVLPMAPRLVRRAHVNVQESKAPDGSDVRQEVLREEWVAVARGPLVFATGLVDGYKTDETVRLPATPLEGWLTLLDDRAPLPRIRLAPDGRAPIDFVPWFGAGGRADGAWRTTWLSLPPADGPAPTTEKIP